MHAKAKPKHMLSMRHILDLKAFRKKKKAESSELEKVYQANNKQNRARTAY